MSRWNHRMCGDCWMVENPIRQDSGGGYIWQPPVMVRDVPPGVCCFCRNQTRLGIWVRRNPADVRCTGRWGEQHKEADE